MTAYARFQQPKDLIRKLVGTYTLEEMAILNPCSDFQVLQREEIDVWNIEFDIVWTTDEEPRIAHVRFFRVGAKTRLAFVAEAWKDVAKEYLRQNNNWQRMQDWMREYGTEEWARDVA